MVQIALSTKDLEFDWILSMEGFLHDVQYQDIAKQMTYKNIQEATSVGFTTITTIVDFWGLGKVSQNKLMQGLYT